MARAHFVKKARKAVPHAEIKKGDSYYWWKFRRGGKRYSKTPPKPSQLTQSEFWGELLSIGEDAEANGPSNAEANGPSNDLQDKIDDIKSRLEQLRDDTQGKFDNMPEGLQQGDTGQLLEERVEALESAISDLEGIDVPDIDSIWSEVTDALGNVSCS